LSYQYQPRQLRDSCAKVPSVSLILLHKSTILPFLDLQGQRAQRLFWPYSCNLPRLRVCDPTSLLDCSCVRSHLGIPYNYRNGIGGILNISFWSLCLFCAKFNEHTKNLSHGQSSKNHVLTGFYFLRDLVDVIYLRLVKFVMK
jgi:hypothetical protein